MNIITNNEKNKSTSRVNALVPQACYTFNEHDNLFCLLRMKSDRRDYGTIKEYAYASVTQQHAISEQEARYASIAHLAPYNQLKPEQSTKSCNKTKPANLADTNRKAQLSQQCLMNKDLTAANDEFISTKCIYIKQFKGQNQYACKRLIEPAYLNGNCASYRCRKQNGLKDETSDDYQINISSQCQTSKNQRCKQFRFINIKNLYSYNRTVKHYDFESILAHQSELVNPLGNHSEFQNNSRNCTALLVSVALEYCLLIKALNASFCQYHSFLLRTLRIRPCFDNGFRVFSVVSTEFSTNN